MSLPIARLRSRPSGEAGGRRPKPNGAVSTLGNASALMPQVAHGTPWRWSITRAAAPRDGSTTSMSGANSPTWSSRSATWPGTCLMKISRMS